MTEAASERLHGFTAVIVQLEMSIKVRRDIKLYPPQSNKYARTSAQRCLFPFVDDAKKASEIQL